MHHLRNILFQKYWLPNGATYALEERTIHDGAPQHQLTAHISNVKSCLRKLPAHEQPSPAEVLELLAPFYGYELQRILGLAHVSQLRAAAHQDGWNYQHRFSENITLDARIFWKNQGYFRATISVAAQYPQHHQLQEAAHHYFGKILCLPLAENVERPNLTP